MPLKTIVSGYITALGTAMTAITHVNNERGYMGLFDKHKTDETTAALLADIDEQIDEGDSERSKVLDYMLELSDEEYDKLLKVAKIYRDANRKAADIMGVPNVTEGEKVAVRVEKSDETEFIETDTEKGKKGSGTKAK